MKNETINLPNLELVQTLINQEKRIKQILYRIRMTPKDNCPLDVSYMNAVMMLIGLPPESEMPKNLNWDPFLNEYTQMVYGDKPVGPILKKWAATIKKHKLKYPTQNRTNEISEVLEQDQRLFQAIQDLGIQKGVFSEALMSWELMYTLLGFNPETQETPDLENAINEMLDETITSDGDCLDTVQQILKVLGKK